VALADAHIEWLQQGWIDRPGDGGQVSGTVEIVGSAARSEMWYYKVEARPADVEGDWSLIGVSYEPVEHGQLAVWDTSGLQGAYLLRLTVIDSTGNFGPYHQVTVNVRLPS
jgi:hypothetical protein